MATGGQDAYPSDPGSAGHPPPHDPSRYAGYPPQTPTTAGYPHDHPQSARSGSFPYDAMSRQPYPHTPGSTSGNPAMSAVQSPTYPYYPPHDMGHYGSHPGSAPPNYGPWPGYGQQMAYNSPGAHSGVQSPTSAGPQRGQVYSFVPIPGAQQHKRPRRRYEEIERMYKCGFNGCEKAYGTLNHLNAHVTMQSHGSKRTPEEFKEIRKEWKARKKEEENQRKAEEERQRQASISQATTGQTGDASTTGSTANSQAAPTPTTPGFPTSPRGPQLPPIGYSNATGAQYPGASAGSGDPNMYGSSQPGQSYYNYNMSRMSPSLTTPYDYGRPDEFPSSQPLVYYPAPIILPPPAPPSKPCDEDGSGPPH